ncbi:hypothetical protein AB0E10_37720 [Streptomyces sp. NPDC048045]|uniref:hypothetical protein n=1 Tax=Streptomyces sp. NPDC048045 TaxID=3154710 RepID=UPI00343AA278
MAPAGEDGPHPAVVPPAGPATPPKAEADSHQAGHARGTGRAARYAVLLTALLTVTAPSSDRGPLTALPSHHGTHGRSTSKAVHAIRVTSGDLLPEAVPTVGDDLQVLHPVARGDTLIVTVTLTHAGSGAVTVTDTAGNTYRPAGHIMDSGRRLLLFALLGAKPLDTLDQITVRWPRATHAYTTVDAFRGITAAGPWGAAESATAHGTGTDTVSSGDLPLCTAGDLLFTAVSSPHKPAFQFAAPWQPLTEPEFPSPPLATAYRSVTSADQHCASHGTAPVPWQSITLRLH